MYGGHHACLLAQTLNLGSVRNFPGKMHAYQAELAASMPMGMDESYTHNQTDTHTYQSILELEKNWLVL